MRNRGVLLAVLLLAGCIGGDKERGRGRPAPKPQQSDANLRQCVADLGRMGVRFERLEDRWFGGGCSATGSVKLLDVGLPIANLGAMKCGLAKPFAQWTREAIQQAARAWLDSRVVKVESMGTYSCRPVNGQSGNKLSEHGRSNAVDISAFILENGRRISVKDGWNGSDGQVRDFLRAIHKSGCRRFNIVLGPDANGYHRDHFHFDMGPGGPYCK